jgi:hypothetical protein
MPIYTKFTIEIDQLLVGNSKKVNVENDIQEQWDNETIDSEFNWEN